MFRLEHDNIKNFILELNNEQIFMINPILSIDCKLSKPYLNLSRQFLVHNQCNYNLIHEYLYDPIKKL
jgi:hypothetical protein